MDDFDDDFSEVMDFINKTKKYKLKNPNETLEMLFKVGKIIEYLKKNYREEYEKELSLNFYSYLKYIPIEIQDLYEKETLEFLKITCYRSFRYLSQNIMLRNLEVCKKAVLKTKYNIEYVPETIKDKCPELFRFPEMSEKEKINNPKLCIKAMKINPLYIEYVPDIIKNNNIEICKLAVKYNGHLIQYIPEKTIIDNIEIYKLALKENSYSFQSLPDKLINNEKMLLIAVENDPKSMEYMEIDFLIKYPNVVEKALNENIKIIKNVPEEVLENHKVFFKKILQDKNKLLVTIDNNKDIYKKDYIITYIPENIMIENSETIRELLLYLLENKEKLNEYKNILRYIPYKIQDKYQELILELYKEIGEKFFSFLSYNIRKRNIENYKNLINKII